MAARKYFVLPISRPRKSWIGSQSWKMIQWIAPTRRGLFRARKWVKCWTLKLYFTAWASLFPCRRNHFTNTWTGAQHWDANSLLFELQAHLRYSHCVVAAWLGNLERLQRASRTYLRFDKQRHLERLLMQAQNAAHRHDLRGSYA
eukprot:12042463-Karenia_brevis.AAC.1